MTTQFRAGDVVRHRPTGEKWVLACADEADVYPCGWPESVARAVDCDLYRAATDQQHRNMLETWTRGGNGGRRNAVCSRQLAALNEAFVGEGI